MSAVFEEGHEAGHVGLVGFEAERIDGLGVEGAPELRCAVLRDFGETLPHRGIARVEFD